MHTTQAWRGWTAPADATARGALTWSEWCARQQRIARVAQRPEHESPFSGRELARLSFVRWLHHTGRLATAGRRNDETRDSEKAHPPGRITAPALGQTPPIRSSVTSSRASVHLADPRLPSWLRHVRSTTRRRMRLSAALGQVGDVTFGWRGPAESADGSPSSSR